MVAEGFGAVQLRELGTSGFGAQSCKGVGLRDYDEAADVFVLGCMLLQIVGHRHSCNALDAAEGMKFPPHQALRSVYDEPWGRLFLRAARYALYVRRDASAVVALLEQARDGLQA